ncbi:MAG: type III secretion system inner rod subunit SctI, partial [Rhizobiaceae bacterium]|nr:type III secretion system inner rod subunit SctI [Rhizobiaceae bacterium]
GAEGVQAATPPSPGDSILDGIQRLRGVFDAREARIADLMDGRTMDAGTLMAMQMEVANFTLLVDITSKLTGKSTQALDTLMKGQ